MLALRQFLFGSVGRRLASVLFANAIFYGVSAWIHPYIEYRAASAGVCFSLLFLWAALGVLDGLITATGLGEWLFYRGWTKEILRDEMAAVGEDAAVTAEPEDVEVDVRALRASGAGVRFGLYFVVLSVAHLLIANSVFHGVLMKVDSVFALAQLRSDDPRERRLGLEGLAVTVVRDPSPAVVEGVVRALEDADEGVAARAVFAAGHLQIGATAKGLARVVEERPALAFTALISLALLPPDDARTVAAPLVDHPAALKEPQALALMIGRLRLPAVERLVAIYDQATDEDTRVAAVWAVGQLVDPRMLDFLVKRLEDPAVAVRCAAAIGLEAQGDLAASPPLRAAFARVEDPEQMCPEKAIPVQEGGATILLVPYWNYQQTLVRALGATLDPGLLRWLVENQEGVAYRTHVFMRKLYDRYVELDKKAMLNRNRERIRLRDLKRRGTHPDAGADGGGP